MARETISKIVGRTLSPEFNLEVVPFDVHQRNPKATEVQTMLRDLGYNLGNFKNPATGKMDGVDGYFGPATQAAVIQFQQNYNKTHPDQQISTNGTMDVGTLEALGRTSKAHAQAKSIAQAAPAIAMDTAHDDKSPVAPTIQAKNLSPTTSPAALVFPVEGGITSSPFGHRKAVVGSQGVLSSSNHMAVDIAAPMGTPIYAAAPGIVSYVGTDPNNRAGYFVTIAHDDGIRRTRYCHLNELPPVKIGDRVTPDTEIGKVGETGNTRGVHLHYELYVGGLPVDPLGVPHTSRQEYQSSQQQQASSPPSIASGAALPSMPPSRRGGSGRSRVV